MNQATMLSTYRQLHSYQVSFAFHFGQKIQAIVIWIQLCGQARGDTAGATDRMSLIMVSWCLVYVAPHFCRIMVRNWFSSERASSNRR